MHLFVPSCRISALSVSLGTAESDTQRCVAATSAALRPSYRIWLAGSYAAEVHFYNIWTVYGAKDPARLDPVVGSATDFKAFVDVRAVVMVVTVGASYPLIQ